MIVVSSAFVNIGKRYAPESRSNEPRVDDPTIVGVNTFSNVSLNLGVTLTLKKAVSLKVIAPFRIISFVAGEGDLPCPDGALKSCSEKVYFMV